MIRAHAIIGKFPFSSVEAALYLKHMNSAMIEAFAVIRETNKYQYRRLLTASPASERENNYY